jgi:hypothetical protein
VSEPTAVVHTRLTKEQAGQPLTLGDVWSEDLQRFIPRGQQFAIDREKREADPAYQLVQYDERRTALFGFIEGKLLEAEYERTGYPVKGAMHDFYRLPDYDLKTVTKGGASKVANLLRFRVGKKRVTSATFTADHGSARVMVELVDAEGRPVGAHEAACSTAEKGFQSPGVRCKYGAKWERDDKGKFLRELDPPDYRAAENDVVSRAGKRAFVGALIVAASLEEVFDIETSTDAAGEEGTEKPRAAAPPKPARKGGPTMAFGDHKGEPLSAIDAAELVKVRDWCEKRDATKWAKFIGEINEELESRRTAKADGR